MTDQKENAPEWTPGDDDAKEPVGMSNVGGGDTILDVEYVEEAPEIEPETKASVDQSDDLKVVNDALDPAQVSPKVIKEVIFRRGQALDVCNIAKFLKKSKEVQYGSSFGEPDDKKIVHRLLELATNHLIIIAERGGAILGVAGIWLEQWEWGSQVQLDVDFIESIPAWRKRGLGLKLVEEIESIADTQQLHLNLTVHSKIKPEAKSRWFEMRGYQYLGSQYIRKPKHGQEKEPNNDDEQQ